MTKTPNYNLPQWEPDDQVKMSDFNEAFSAIDAVRPAVGVLDTYDGSADVTVDLGRQPKMVMVGNKLGWTNSVTGNSVTCFCSHAVALPGHPGQRSGLMISETHENILEVTETGFCLHSGMDKNAAPYYYLAIF